MSKHYVINEMPGPVHSKQVCGIQYGLETAVKTEENFARLKPGTTYYVMEAVMEVTAQLPVTHKVLL